MRRAVAFAVLCLTLSAPAMAGEQVRLVTGGVTAPRGEGARFSGADHSAELFSTGSLRLGAVMDSTPLASGERTALGGFASYGLGDGLTLSSSLRGDEAASMADFSASVMGGLGTASVTLGYEWAGQATTFSLNPAHRTTWIESSRPSEDWSLALSFSHELTSAFSLSGFAAATRSEYEHRTTEQGFRLGAGFGYRF